MLAPRIPAVPMTAATLRAERDMFDHREAVEHHVRRGRRRRDGREGDPQVGGLAGWEIVHGYAAADAVGRAVLDRHVPLLADGIDQGGVDRVAAERDEPRGS